MSARGRGAVTVKRGVPNLALAGKRESTNGAPDPRSSGRGGGNRGKGRGRGGRGGGRGGGRDKDNRPALIQSAGIFSEGLSGADPSRRTKEKENTTISFSTNSRNRVNTASPEEQKAMRDSGKASFKGWEEMWESDEEEDMAQLAELLQDGFISDYKRGKTMPLVLPVNDEPQFLDVLSKDAKVEFMSDDEEDRKYDDLEDDKKATKRNFEDMEREMEFGNPTYRLSSKAATVFKNIGKDDNNTMFMLQLPSVVNVMTSSDLPGAAAGSSANGIGGVGTSEMKPMCDGGLGVDSATAPTVPRLPKGRSIGKLQVTKRGRVLLKVGGVTMDVSKSIPTGQQESVILLETSARAEPQLAGRVVPLRVGGPEGRDAVYHLGKVRHHLTASLDWEDVRPMSEEHAKADAARAMMSPSRAPRAADVGRLRAELEQMERERDGWKGYAEMWARP